MPTKITTFLATDGQTEREKPINREDGKCLTG